MEQITEFFEKLFSTADWPARWYCGNWSEFHGWLYIVSDIAIWVAYFIIPFLLIRFVKKKPSIPLPTVFWLFGAFILFCGLTHLIDALIFWWPAYRLSAVLRFITATISWITVIAIYKYLPVALSLKTTKEFEAELFKREKSEAKFVGLLESAPDAMVIAGSDGRIQMVNAQTERIFGYERNEIIAKEVEFLIPERFHNKHTGHRHGYVEHPKVRGMGVGMELFGKRKNGSEFPVEISLSPMKLVGEEGILVISAIRDITKQKETEAEIRKLNENLELLIIERTSELELALKKEKTARIEMNQNQLRLAFLTKASNKLASSLDYSEILNNLANMVTPEIADWCAIDEVEEDGTIRRIMVTHVDPEKISSAYELQQKYPSNPDVPLGIHEVIRTLTPELYPYIPDEQLESLAHSKEYLRLMQKVGIRSAIILPLMSRNKIYGVLTLVLSDSGRLFDEGDLEFAKELARRATLAIENAKMYKKVQDSNIELELRVNERTIELENINKELEAFSYSVSHDLRAPLRSIDGFSNKILKDYSNLLDEKGKDYFNRVVNASHHMGHLIDDLIKLARISRLDMNMEEINLSDIARSIVGELKESNPERITSISIQDDMIISGDRNLIHIAMQNLLGNAWKYSKNKPETEIEFSTMQKEGQIIYFIRDNGAGFDMRYIDKLFGAFQRLHSISEFEGTGIGLATVLRIIRRHHGTIWAESEVDIGTTFFFTL
jgi:PAS domain S-box-containing protein